MSQEARSPVDAQVASVLDKPGAELALEKSVISKRQEQGTSAMYLEKITPTADLLKQTPVDAQMVRVLEAAGQTSWLQ